MTDYVRTKGDTSIGAISFPGMEKPIVGIVEGNTVVKYGTFDSERVAEMFMVKLAEFVGAKEIK